MKKLLVDIATLKKSIVGLIILVILSTVVIALLHGTDQGTDQQDQGTSEVDYTDVNTHKYTADAIREHYSSRFNCWTIIDGKVYTITHFIASHKDREVLETTCGTDGTEIFKEQDVYQQLLANSLPDTIIQRGVLYEKPQRNLFDY